MLGPVGKPQWIAGTLLLIFLAQCTWLITHSLRSGDMDLREWYRLDTGLRLWHRSPRTAAALDPHSALGPGLPPRIRDNDGIDPDHSALWYLISSAPLLVWPGRFQSDSLLDWGFLARMPHLAFGLLLGASVWYVARRLYGNEGGFIALILLLFLSGNDSRSLGLVRGTGSRRRMGSFGTIFTGIAVAHTLYAPREVVLWNWRRTLLLGVSIALAVGSQFSLFVLAPLVLIFMLYVAPTRRGAAATIWLTACGIALVLLFAAYFFRSSAFVDALRHASRQGFTPQVFSMPVAYRELLAVLGQNSPALVFALPIALVTYALWPRTRYSGNTAPLMVAIFCLLLGFATPHYQGLGFQLIAVPFLFVFVAGICADLLETETTHAGAGLHLWPAAGLRLLCLVELARVGFALTVLLKALIRAAFRDRARSSRGRSPPARRHVPCRSPDNPRSLTD